MDEKFDIKKIYAFKSPVNRKDARQQAFDRIKEKDTLIEKRRAQIVEVIKGLIVSEGMQNLAKELTFKVLQHWMNNYPDKFFGLKNTNGLLQTYFYGEISNLKFKLGLTDKE